MPLYDYQCSACGHEMEVLQKMSAEPLTDCSACQTSSLKKKVTAAAFRLSGSGWYETDFKKDNKKNLTGDKQDSKPADKAEKKDSKTPESAKSAASKPASVKTSDQK